MSTERTMPAVLWKGRVVPLSRALGRLTLSNDALSWEPMFVTPFFPAMVVRVDEIRSARVGGLLFGPDFRVETDSKTFRFGVLRRAALRAWLRDTGIAER